MAQYFLLVLIPMLASYFIQWRLKSKFEKYSQIPFRGNLSGAEVAEKMLRDNGITDVQIISVDGQLTDHYNPTNKTVNLSPEVYNGRSVASAAVAAHECGHAVQHAHAYVWLGMRSALVPAVSFASNWTQWILMAGMLMLAFAGMVGAWVLLVGIVLFAFTTIFSFITLPVEFDASNRALVWLENSGITNSQEHEQAKDALKWAAMTYVVAAVASLATLLYYILIFLRRR
jgi:hypothetical protein